MTAQIPDSFLFQDKKFSIVGVNGAGLFDPYVHKLTPLPRITSCWRGYVCTYKTLYNKLLLDILQVNLGDEGPTVNGNRPTFDPKNIFDNTYNDLNLHMDFTGGMLIANAFLQHLYVHMGFHPAWKYETVFELVISQGYVLESRDVSQQMAELRDRMVRQPLEPNSDASKDEIEKWIASTFRMEYRF
jgi:hypothetical protein